VKQLMHAMGTLASVHPLLGPRRPVLLLGRQAVAELLPLWACIEAVEAAAFRALRAGVLTQAEVSAELGQVVAGLRPGRESPDEIVVFDSTGTAIQDVAAAALAYERAVAVGRGFPMDLAG